MKKKILFFLSVFVISIFNAQDYDKADLSKKNISHTDVDEETAWIRVLLKNPKKWGFINKDSTVVIPFEYDFLNPFENGLAYAENDGKEFFITKKNLKLQGDYDGVKTFSYGLAGVNKNGKWGFINNTGKLALPLIYDWIDVFRYSGLCAVKKNGKAGFINQSGKEIIPITYDGVYQHMQDKNVLVEKNGKWAIFDNTGKQLSEFKYDDLDSFLRTYITDFSKDVFTRDQSTFFENGAAVVKFNGKYEFINSKAEPAFPNNKFDSATAVDTFHNAIVKRNGKYGIIKSTGEFKVPLEYDYIDYYDDNHAFSEYYNVRKGKVYSYYNKDLKKIGESYEPIYNNFSSHNPTIIYKNLNGKYGVADWQGNTVIPFEYDEIYEIERTPYLYMKKGKFYGVMTEKGEVKIPAKYENLNSVYGKFDDEEPRKKHYFITDNKVIDINNNIIIEGYDSIETIHYNHNKLIVSKNKKFGIIDINGKILLPMEFDKVYNIVEHGPRERQFIMKNGKTGFIEYETFKIIIPPIYDYFEERAGFVFVSKNEKFGILDINNKTLCPFIYDEIKPHIHFGHSYNGEDDEIFARNGSKHFEIEANGKIIKEITKKEFDEKTVYK